jgi:hypothetical protein
MMASQGKQGKPGEPGKIGPKGDNGKDAAEVVGMDISEDGVVSLLKSNGAAVTYDANWFFSMLKHG